ncbi:MAG: ParA family protein [Rhodomicrobium sp.]
MNIVTVAQQKGGTSKTCLAIHMAAEAARKGHYAAILELDRQGTASSWGEKRPYVEDMFKDIDPRKVFPEVVHVDTARLYTALSALQKAGASLVVIDLPGTHSPAITPAIRAADFVLIPSRPNEVDLAASAETLASVNRLNKPYAYVLTFIPSTGGRTEEARDALEEEGHTVAPGGLGQLVDFADAIAAGTTVQELKPQGRAAEQVRALWKWLEKQLKERAKDDAQASVA